MPARRGSSGWRPRAREASRACSCSWHLATPGLRELRGAPGPKGDTGATGPKGDKGDTGAQSPAYSAGPGLGLTDNTFFLAPPIELSASTDGPVLRSTNEGSGPAAAFTSAGAPFTVSSSTKVDNLNADFLDGRSADSFGRAALAGVGGSYVYPNDEEFVERTKVTINAPIDGLMLVIGSTSIDTLVGGATSCNPCLGVIRLRDTVSGAKGFQQVATFGNGSTEVSTALTTSWLFVVEAGDRTFALDVVTTGTPADKISWTTPR